MVMFFDKTVLGVLSLEVCEMHTQNPSFQLISTAFSLHKDMKIQVRTKTKTQNPKLLLEMWFISSCVWDNKYTHQNQLLQIFF